MGIPWNDEVELARVLLASSKARRAVRLRPWTAHFVALKLMEASALPAHLRSEPEPPDRGMKMIEVENAITRQAGSPSPNDAWRVDLYAEGSCVYRMKRDGSAVLDIAAWARNVIVARAAFEKLRTEYPNDHFVQRRKAHVEADSKELDAKGL